jgi:hypothetical protein
VTHASTKGETGAEVPIHEKENAAIEVAATSDAERGGKEAAVLKDG